MTTARIGGPAGLGEIYAGQLGADADWCRQVEQQHYAGEGLVVVTGAAERLDMEAAWEIMEAQRAGELACRTNK